MKLLTIFSAVATSAAFAAASPTPSHKDDVQLVARASVGENDQTSNAHCERQTYRIKSSANRTEFDLDKMLPQTNQSRITELFVEYVTNMPQFMSDYVKGKQQHSHTFDISGILCKPKNNADDSRAIQLLVHGIGYDSRYWNLYADGVPEKKYSYVYQVSPGRTLVPCPLSRTDSVFRLMFLNRLNRLQSRASLRSATTVSGLASLTVLGKATMSLRAPPR